MPTFEAGVFAIACYLLLLALLTRRPRRETSSRALWLLRALFPSWRFFEDFTDVPALYYRLARDAEAELGDWQPCLGRLERRARALFVNPEGNLLLACQSLLHQIESDLQQADEENPQSFAASASYQLAMNLVNFAVEQAHGLRSAYRYQFKLCAEKPGEEGTGESTVLLVSQIHEVP